MTTIPTITPLPTPVPQTTDPTDFASRADAFLTALPTMVTEENATIAAMNTVAGEVSANAAAAATSVSDAAVALAAAISATNYAATSASSLSITAGSKAVHLNETGKAFAIGDQVVIISRADTTQRLYGTITAWDGVDDMTVSVATAGLAGSGGPFTSWFVLSAVWSTPGAAGTDLLAGTSSQVAITPKTVTDANAEVTLTDAATIALDLATGINFKVTLGGNRTLGNPTNQVVGRGGVIRVIQDGTGSRTLAYGANWKRSGGAPVLSTAAAAEDEIAYRVLASGRVWYDLKKNPS